MSEYLTSVLTGFGNPAQEVSAVQQISGMHWMLETVVEFLCRIVGDSAVIDLCHEVPGDASVVLLDRHEECFKAFEYKLTTPIRCTMSSTQLCHHIEGNFQSVFLSRPSSDWETIGDAGVSE